MATIVINQFATWDAAKNYFAVVLNSDELKGGIFKASGGLVMQKEDGAQSWVEESEKYYVFTSASDLVSDFGH